MIALNYNMIKLCNSILSSKNTYYSVHSLKESYNSKLYEYYTHSINLGSRVDKMIWYSLVHSRECGIIGSNILCRIDLKLYYRNLIKDILE
jgi:hypothetical protein